MDLKIEEQKGGAAKNIAECTDLEADVEPEAPPCAAFWPDAG